MLVLRPSRVAVGTVFILDKFEDISGEIDGMERIRFAGIMSKDGVLSAAP